MIIEKRYSAILMMFALAVCLAGTLHAAGHDPSPGVREFTMTAKNYEFDPGVITVKKGEKVRLIITATDRDHGIKIEGYDIDQVLKKGDDRPPLNSPPTRPERSNLSAPSTAAWATGK